MSKYQVIRLIKIKKPFTKAYILKQEKVYPYRMSNLGHAKACARMINSKVIYTDLNNNICNVIVQDDVGNIVFVAREHINGIYGQELD